ncbi:hypothetical protein MPSYJ_00690 [Mycolicibacterium psychrotolerans]|uniref:DUF4262 domain-containing protein n=2 Tax=Mycolicibacterium psychrotolerans TaxID=216929 RepID=A0A7I7M334_9MYCO|nr:hypothetical protein MPSYJ_00690 [Mycolicibacterium psychrotolerans]
MCWQCDNPDKTTDDYLDVLRETIKDQRWAVQFVESDNRPFAYTVGLHENGLPELVVTGMRAQTSAKLLNVIGEQMVDEGMVLQPAEHIDCGRRYLLEVVEVEHPDVHLKFALGLYGSTIRALQLVWADDAGRWPWDRGWGHGRRRQPVLGIRGPLPN